MHAPGTGPHVYALTLCILSTRRYLGKIEFRPKTPEPMNQMQQDPTKLVVFETENSRALLNLVPKTMREEILKLNPETLLAPERKLKKRLKPSTTTSRLRWQFWSEFHRAQALGRNMSMTNVYGGVCSDVYFYHEVVKDPNQLTWLITPPSDYMIGMEVALQELMEQVAEVADKAVCVSEDGKVDAKALMALLNTMQFVHAVVKGPLVQRVETKSLNVNVNQPSEPKTKDVTQFTPAQLTEKIQRLQKELAEGSGPVIVDDSTSKSS